MTAIVSQPIRIPIGGSRQPLSYPFEIIDDEEYPEFTGRGRDPSPKRTALSLPSSPGFSPDSPLHRHSIEAHHSLPPVSAESIPDDPILYLPPLLSPLPHAHQEAHKPHRPSEEELSDFNTRLPDIDPASLVLHQALHNFSPIDDQYAKRRYDRAFNWDDLSLPIEVEREWYCVVFRSRRKPESSSLSLYQADREAHEEAVHNGGLVMYWYGVPDETGLNLATCIWQSRRHAIQAISGPKHVLAMRQAAGAYEVYDLERWVLHKEAGFRELSLRKWEGGEVGW
jgi:hypothetical protein